MGNGRAEEGFLPENGGTHRGRFESGFHRASPRPDRAFFGSVAILGGKDDRVAGEDRIKSRGRHRALENGPRQ